MLVTLGLMSVREWVNSIGTSGLLNDDPLRTVSPASRFTATSYMGTFGIPSENMRNDNLGLHSCAHLFEWPG